MAYTGRSATCCPLIVTVGLCVFAAVAAGCGASSAGSPTSTGSLHDLTAPSKRHLPAGVLPRSTILSRYRSTRPGVTTEAKLVSLAALDTSSKGELTQCRFRGCPPGALVWLVLQKGPPGSFADDSGPNLRAGQASLAAAWSLAPVNATTGRGRGDTEVAALGQLRSSPWGQLQDLASGS